MSDATFAEASTVTSIPEADLRTMARDGFEITAERIPLGVMVGIAAYVMLAQHAVGSSRLAAVAAKIAARDALPDGNRVLLMSLQSESPKVAWFANDDPRLSFALGEMTYPFVVLPADGIARSLFRQLERLRGMPAGLRLAH